jgi:hypothetical protein
MEDSVIVKFGEAKSFSLGIHSDVSVMSITADASFLLLGVSLVVLLVSFDSFRGSEREINGLVEFLDRSDNVLLEIEGGDLSEAGDRCNSCNKRLHLFCFKFNY